MRSGPRIDKCPNKVHPLHKGLFMYCPRVLFASAFTLLACFHLSGQLVISVHSGVVHFSEGAVFLDDRPLDQKFGTFSAIKAGSTLRTEEGRAEVLLTPGVFLRVDEHSSMRMISTAVKDTRVEFLDGSVILDSVDASTDNPVVLTHKGCQIRFPQKGIYRMDSEPPVLQVYNGEAEVTRDGKASSVDPSHLFFFSLGLQTQKFGDGADDEFYQWSKDRSEFITADNRSAAQSAGDPGQMDNGQIPSRDPDLYLGTPTYGDPYGGLGSTLPMDSSLLYSNVPFGMGVWSMYSVYFVYLPLYHRWPGRSPWPARTPYPGLPPTRIGISHRSPIGAPSFAPRPVPRAGAITPRYSSPISVGLPRGGVTHIGAPAIGHR